MADAASMIGGADKVAIVSAIEFAKRGHRVTLLTSIGPPDPSTVGVANLEVVCLHQPEIAQAPSKARAFLTQTWNRAAMDRFAEVLRDVEPGNTVIHAHCYLKMLSVGPIKMALDSGLPFAITVHDYGLACPSRIFYHQRQEAICHRKPMGLACMTTNCMDQSYVMKVGRIVRFSVQTHVAKIAKRLKNVVFVSQFSGDIVAPYLNSNCRQTVIDNPVDPQRAPRVEAETHERFLYVGRLVNEKAPVLLAKAAKLANVPVTFVGEGPERDKVMAANPNAEITGWVTPEQVHARYRSARAFVIPSIWYECSPLVTVEALSHGLPVLCSDSNASRESVVEGENGYLFASGDAESLAARLRLLQDDAAVRALSEGAYARFWADPPSTARHIDALESYYRDLLNVETH